MTALGMRVGVVGTDDVASSHVAAWTALGARVHVHAVTGLDACVEGADIVDVCTPTSTHDRIVLAAAGAGRHVVCEQPLAPDVRSAARMVEACHERGVLLFPGHVFRYVPAYEAAHRMVHDGAVGQLAVVRLTRSSPAPGGQLLDQLIHDVDLARWVAGEVVHVFAKVTGDGSATVAHALLRHATGAMTQVTGAWGGRGTPWRTTFKIRGTSGGLDHDSTGSPTLRWDNGEVPTDVGGQPPADLWDPHLSGAPYRRALADVARSVRDGTTPPVPAEEALAALAVAEACATSCRDGRPVEPALR